MWSCDSRCPIAAEEVFSLYEQNRRFVDRERLSGREPRLIRELGKAFGRGFDLTDTVLLAACLVHQFAREFTQRKKSR